MKLTEGNLPEITIKGVILGVTLSIILAAANAYLGLFAGMTVSASIPASVMTMGILKLFKKNNILENNIAQTTASAGEALAAGVIFTLPALVIMDYWSEFNYVWITVIAAFGGVLGVLFTIPLRRALITDDKLKFPESIAVVEILKTGQKAGSDVKYIAQSSLVAGLFKLCSGGLALWTGIAEGAKAVGGTLVYFGANLSAALLAVGYIVGLNISVLVFLGGLCNWLIAIPICAAFQSQPVVDGQVIPALAWAKQIWSQQTRYIGVGGMLIGGLWTIVRLRQPIVHGIKSGLNAYRRVEGRETVPDRQERDIPMKWVLIFIAASVVPLFLLYQAFVGKVGISLPMAITMIITGFMFSAVAAYMAGLVGSSNNPISGVTIATVLVSALLLLVLMGAGAKGGPSAAIIVGGVICCAAAISGDNMQDLKAGYMLGSTPWKMQTMEMVGTLAAAVVLAPVLTLLFKAYGFAGHSSARANALIAPQANLMASVSKGVFEGKLPWNLVIVGAAIGAMIILFDAWLERRKSSFRSPVLAVALGFYLPFEVSVPILIGGIVHQIILVHHRRRNLAAEVKDTSMRHGLLLASGLITGEALMGIFLAVPIVVSGKSDVLAIFSEPFGPWPGVLLLIAIAYWLYHVSMGHHKV
jgi:putative OPT family oligopeptide transporter